MIRNWFFRGLMVVVALLLGVPLTNAAPPSFAKRIIVITIDGTREDRMHAWGGDDTLIPWALQRGTYIPFLEDRDFSAVTDVGHPVNYGSANPGRCNNFEGNPFDPMLFELMRQQWGINEDQVVVATGKDHVYDLCRYSMYFGEQYQARGILRQTPQECPANIPCEGPDSLTVQAALEHLSTHDVYFMGINLSRPDQVQHWAPGWMCCGGDSLLYFAKAEATTREAIRLVMEEIVPFIESTAPYAGNTIIIITTDHGRHIDGWFPNGGTNHGHGWPDTLATFAQWSNPLDDGCQTPKELRGKYALGHSLDGPGTCALSCDGCRKRWAFVIGPGIKVGATLSGSYTVSDLAVTERVLAGGITYPVPYFGSVIEEMLDDTVGVIENPNTTTLLPIFPNPSSSSVSFTLIENSHPGSLSILDASGREIFNLGTYQGSGKTTVTWDGRDKHGNRVPSGRYFARLTSKDGGEITRSVTLIH